MHAISLLAVLTLFFGTASTAPSTLRVAVCNPGSVPYDIVAPNGSLAGFDIGMFYVINASCYVINNYHADLWNRVYSDMFAIVSASKNSPNPLITPAVSAMIGSSPPKLLSMSSSKIQSQLGTNDLDIGMCGFLFTQDRFELFDFVNPFYLPSGFQGVVVKPTRLPSILDVLTAVANCVDSEAQLVIFILLLFVFIFGHLVAAAEVISMTGGSNIRGGYSESTMDGMWLSVVVMSTVGFGDLFPKSLSGRFVIVVWMFVSISFMAMLLAVITSNFLTLQLIPDDDTYHIEEPKDLLPFSLVTASAPALQAVQDSNAGHNLTITKFPTNTQTEVFRALLNGTYQVAIDRPDTIQYFNNLVPEFQGRLMPVGVIFNQEGVSYGISRPKGHEHPLFRLLSITVATVGDDQAWVDATRSKWFGPDPSVANSDATAIRAQLTTQAVTAVLWAALQIIIVITSIWVFISAVAVLRRAPKLAVRNEVCAAIRTVLGLTQGDVQPGHQYTNGYHTLKGRVLEGIRRLLAKDGARAALSPSQVEDAIAKADGAGDAGTGLRRQLFGHRKPARMEAAGAAVGEDMVWVDVTALLDLFAGELALRRPEWWERLCGVDFRRLGREYVRKAFFGSFEEARKVFEEAVEIGKLEELELMADDVADVLMDLMNREVRGLFASGGLLFPHRLGGEDYSDAERSFDQLTRSTKELEARVARGDSVAAAAYAAAAAAAAAAGAQTWPASAPSSPPAPHGTLAEAPAVSEGRGRAEPEIPLSFRHRITWDPRGVC